MTAITKFIHGSVLVTAFLLSPVSLQASLEVSSFFGDHMVLQREQEIPVWGTATPGEKVTAIFRKTTVTARTGEDGKWRLRLPAQAVGEPAILKIRSGEDSITFEDVLVGEIWICSGQSNMEWRVERSANPEEEIAAADYPSIRFFDVSRAYSPEPLNEVTATWTICSPETVPSFSAVGYYFGRKLWKELNVPIGLVSANWGGTPAEAWTPLPILQSHPDYRELVDKYHQTTKLLEENPDLEEQLQKKFDDFVKQGEALLADPPRPEDVWFRSESNIPGTRPIAPDTVFFSETDGLAHVRTTFTLSEAQAKTKGARIRLGEIDNYDITWINGIEVGRTGRDMTDARKEFRDYEIPDGTLRPGANVIVLQVVDWYRDAIFGKNIDRPEIRWPSGKTFPLPDDWEMKIIVDWGPQPPRLDRTVRNTGSYLWNGMVHPLIPAAFQGVIWYQGESNASRAAQYRTLFPDMIRAWRTAWGRGDFPFYFVQLANIEDRTGWPELREAQRETLALPNTGMAVIVDIGDPDDVHPRNKQDVGKRLALWALANTYGFSEPAGWLGTLPGIGRFFQQPIPHSGPLYREAIVEGDHIRLRFDHTDGGLSTRDGQELKGFTLAEESGPFLPAQARIEGETIIVSHPEIKNPAAVRYGWAVNPDGNLPNGTGIPASPFRTDDRPFNTAR